MKLPPKELRVHSASARQWLWTGLVWLGFGLLTATQTVTSMRAEGMHHAWTRLFFSSLLCWVVWALATPFIQQLGQRFPPNLSNGLRNWPLHLVACTAVGAASAAWEAWLEGVLRPWGDDYVPKPFVIAWRGNFRSEYELFLILYAAILAVGYYLDSRKRLAQHEIEAAQLQQRLSQAQLDALRRQLEPHFLFNALNGIAGLIRDNRNADAVEMIAGLSDLLRRVLDGSEKQQVPLGEEMEVLQKYLEIQKMRFADRLQVSVNVPPELLATPIPSFILQPMVENAIQHGIAKRAAGGEIHIAASRQDGLLTIRIHNSGPSLPARWQPDRSGIGLANVRGRLQSLYGDACALHLRNHESGGVEASLSLPFEARPL